MNSLELHLMAKDAALPIVRVLSLGVPGSTSLTLAFATGLAGLIGAPVLLPSVRTVVIDNVFALPSIEIRRLESALVSTLNLSQGQARYVGAHISRLMAQLREFNFKNI